MSAIEELNEYLNDGEVVEAIVFGDWGWSGYGEPEEHPVPIDLRGKLLTIEQAEPYMQNWCFLGGYGSADCYATYVWTNNRVIWITQYDGLTNLDSAPRNPSEVMPDMPGG